MEYSIYTALKNKLEGDIAVHKTNIQIYMNSTVGIGAVSYTHLTLPTILRV